MLTLTSIEQVEQFIQGNELGFIYVLTDRWSVCHGLLPQVEDVLKDFPRIKMGIINGEKVPEIAGYLMAFTVPVLVLYLDGKEVLREARMVHLEKFHEKISRIYEAI